jgi:fasciclin domain-containing protein
MMNNRAIRYVHIFSIGGIICLFLFVIAGLGSCKKNPPPAPAPTTPLQQLVNTDTTLSLFHRMLFRANENGLLTDNSITVLLPTNTALRAAGYNMTIIDSSSAYVIDNLVRYHFLTSLITPDSNGYKSYLTQAGYNIYGMKDSTGQIWFNGNPVTGKSTTVGKALTYRLNIAPMQGPVDSLTDLLNGDTSLAYLAEAYKRTNFYDSFLLSGNYTILAPDNSAFINAGYDSLGAIDSANFAGLVTLLQAQVVTGSYFTNILKGQTTIPSFSGGSIAVTIQNGVLQFSGPHNTVPANLLTGNQTAGNTIIVQRVDGLIVP